MQNIHQFKGPVRMVSGKYGDMFYNKHDAIIGRSLEYYGEYCEHEMELFRAIIKPGICVWEIGANTGSQSVGLSQMAGPNGAFIAVEPQIELFKILTSNLCLNNCQNARSLNLAMGDHDGVINLPKVNYNAPNNFGGIGFVYGIEESKTPVELRTLDSLCEFLPAPDFIKIDVEGMETEVFKGGAKTIKIKQPIIYAENELVNHSQRLLKTLFELDYECYWHISTYFNENNIFANKIQCWAHNMSSFNMLCVPKSRNIQIEGLKKAQSVDEHPLKKD